MNQAEENEFDYSNKYTRIDSFQNWSKSDIISPEELAEAGFYYTGVADKVKCYACNGGLEDWTEFDNPMYEHALFFGDHCMFMKLVKGDQFIEDVKSLAEANHRDSQTKPRYCEQSVIQKTEIVSTSSSILNKNYDENFSWKCKICYMKELNALLTPCGHATVCVECANLIQVCPVCRSEIISRIKIYFS